MMAGERQNYKSKSSTTATATADATLNANRMGVRWHESQQKAGFKFLVTQMMGYLTGGPQRYTGRPMEEAHMHLAITPNEWTRFMEVAEEAAHVPVAARREQVPWWVSRSPITQPPPWK